MEVSGQLHAQAASPCYPSCMRLGVPQNLSEPYYYYYYYYLLTCLLTYLITYLLI